MILLKLIFFGLFVSALSISIEEIAQKLAVSVSNVKYDLHTIQNNHMDCLKPIVPSYDKKIDKLPDLIGVFHFSDQATQYSKLCYAQYSKETDKWSLINILSQRGSQGTIFSISSNGLSRNAYLISYQLENHQKGNTLAVRYYQTISDIRSNNFMYEYQIAQIIDSRLVKNIGTPSLQYISIIKSNEALTLPDLESYMVEIRFHFSPDGSHDYPGMGFIQLNPLKDFVVNGTWIGGCISNYRNWQGVTNQGVITAIRNAGGLGKIGQRDWFQIGSPPQRYYLYQANLKFQFDWRNWRIFVLSEDQKKAIQVPFKIGGAIDFANPHISLLSKNQSKSLFGITFFVPSEAISPQIQARAGQMIFEVLFN